MHEHALCVPTDDNMFKLELVCEVLQRLKILSGTF